MSERKHPIPTRCREFTRNSALLEDDESVLVTMTLHCPRCHGRKLILLFRYEQVHVGSDAGKTLPFDPVWVACSTCRYYSLLFDGATDGFNGVFDEREVRIPFNKAKAWEAAKEDSYGVRVGVQFDTDVAELDERGDLVPDAFHWLNLTAEWHDGSTDDVINFETA